MNSGGLAEALGIFAGASLTLLTATSLGHLCFGRVLRDWPERFVTGAAVLSLIGFLLCAVHLTAAIWLVLFVIGIAAYRLAPAGRVRVQEHWSQRALPFALVFAAYSYLYLMNAMAPEFSPDGSGYHLGLVTRYLREGGFRPIPWNMYANFPEGAEMLFLFAFPLGQHSAAALLHFTFLAALAWQMILYARRSGFPIQGACAALLVFACPLMGKDATAAYNDAALAACAFVLFSLLERWDVERSHALLIPIGLIAGFAFSVKYTAALGIVWAAGLVLAKADRRLRSAGVVVACAALVAAPWLVKNWLWVGNPLAPLYNHWFPNPNFTSAFEADYRSYLALYDLKSRWQIPMALTTSGALVGVLGPVFWLAPVGLLALRRREGRRLWLAALVFGATYFSNIGARFLLPSLPFIAMAMSVALGAGLAGRGFAIALASLHAVLSWPAVIPAYANETVWRLHDAPWKWAFRFRPAEEFLKERMPQYQLDRLIDRVTPRDATVFTFQAIPEAYTSRRILVDYESASNHVAGETLLEAVDPGLKPTWLATFPLAARNASAIRILQSGAGQSQWRVYELRAFAGTTELPRTHWRGDAHPFPWNVARAFDNDALTFWECGDYLEPNQSLTVDLGQSQTLDRVTVQSGYAQGDVKLSLAVRDASGTWQTLPAPPEIGTFDVPDLRRPATAQLHKWGIDYVLLFATDPPAADIRGRPDDWGLEFVGESDGGRLYKIR